MTPVVFDLPVNPAEAGELANLVFEHAGTRPLTDELRSRLAARAATLKLETITPHFGSLERDPVHKAMFYLAVDGSKGEQLLLHLSLASAPSSGTFPKAMLIGRMRRVGGPELVVNASPFGPGDRANVLKYATVVNSAFLPRPQGSQPGIAVGTQQPEIRLPAAFDAFRAILKRTGRNVASIVQVEGAETQHLYHTALWAAIRVGWREGYNLEANRIVVGGTTADEIAASVEAAKQAIREAVRFSKFTLDASRVFGGDTAGLDEAWICEEFLRPISVSEQVYEFTREEVQDLAVRLGAGLTVTEQLYDFVRQTRAAQKQPRGFDFELSMEQAATATTPRELIFCLHWLKARGRAAQLVSPRLGEQVTELAAIARHYQGTLSVACEDSTTAAVLDAVGRANCRTSIDWAAGGAGERIQWISEHLL